jgi:hypothetical protein
MLSAGLVAQVTIKNQYKTTNTKQYTKNSK